MLLHRIAGSSALGAPIPEHNLSFRVGVVFRSLWKICGKEVRLGK